MPNQPRHPPKFHIGDPTVAPTTVDPFTEVRITAIHGDRADLTTLDGTQTYLNVPLAELVHLGAPLTP